VLTEFVVWDFDCSRRPVVQPVVGLLYIVLSTRGQIGTGVERALEALIKTNAAGYPRRFVCVLAGLIGLAFRRPASGVWTDLPAVYCGRRIVWLYLGCDIRRRRRRLC